VCTANELGVCPDDCPACGDGLCTGSETVQGCPFDCLVCGDGTCVPTYETSFSCPIDCGRVGDCGDGVCVASELVWCPADCGAPTCGNNICEARDFLACAWECLGGLPPGGGVGGAGSATGGAGGI
jgi:hypothetical protein